MMVAALQPRKPLTSTIQSALRVSMSVCLAGQEAAAHLRSTLLVHAGLALDALEALPHLDYRLERPVAHVALQLAVIAYGLGERKRVSGSGRRDLGACIKW